MSSPSETTLIVLATAFQAQLISRATAEFWQLVTAIGLTITPLLARIGHDVARRIEMGNSEVEAEEAPPRRTVVVGFRSEEHTPELQSLMRISYAGFCLKKKNNIKHKT